MKIGALMMGVAATVGLLAPTMSSAAETRSAAALPTSRAPVHGVRHVATMRNASMQSDSDSTGGYIAAGVAAAVVIGGVIVAVSNDHHPAPASGG
ncbi:MAG: hypothetical protein ACTHM8_06615 [Sphingomonas sp.]